MMTIGPGNQDNQDNQDNINSLPPEQSNQTSWGGWLYSKMLSTKSDDLPSVPSKIGESSPSYFQTFKNIASPVANVVSFVASPVTFLGKKAIDYSVNFAGKAALGYFEIPFIDEDTPARLQNLDVNGKLPVLADTLVSIISSKISGKYFGIPFNSSAQAALKPSIERVLANLACYSPAPAEGEKGQLLTNICKNLFKILNPNEETYSKLRASSPENDDIISDLLNRSVQKREVIQNEIAVYEAIISRSMQNTDSDETYFSQSEKPQFMDASTRAEYSKKIKKLTQEKEGLFVEIDRLNKLKIEYEKFFEEDSIDNGFDDDGFEEPCGITERDWFLEEFSKNKRELDFDSIAAQILKAAGAEGNVMGYLGGYLAPILKDFSDKFNTPSAFSPDEATIFSGHQPVSEGIIGLVQSSLPVVINQKEKDITSFLVAALADNAIEGVDSLWIENFVKALCNPNEPELQKSLLVIGQYLSPHLIHALEHLASKSQHEGANLLESALLNGIELFSRHLVGNETNFRNAIINFDNDGMQAKAYRVCEAYIQSKGIIAENLTHEDVKEILKGLDENEVKSLLESFPEIQRTPNHLLLFFKFKDGARGEEKQNSNLIEAFGNLAAEVIAEAGLDQVVVLDMFIKSDDLKLYVSK